MDIVRVVTSCLLVSMFFFLFDQKVAGRMLLD